MFHLKIANNKWKTHFDSVKAENHLPLLEEGTGLPKATASQTHIKKLKHQLVDIQAQIKHAELNKPDRATSRKVSR